MKTMNVRWTRAILFGCAVLMFPGCDKSDEPMGQGQAEFQVTDAPSDDASIQSVFVTVSDIKVDGQSVAGYTRQTIDLKAYREGNVKVLGSANLSAKGYSTVSLVLDSDTDASGNSPGSYVLTSDNSKFKLGNGGAIEVVVNKGWNVTANAKTTIVLDFDLRKAIRAMSDQNVRYSFVSNDDLRAAVRLVSEDKAGIVSGSYTEQSSTNSDMIVVYAYKEGTYNADTETVAQGDDAIFFKNAVSSTTVNNDLNRSFKLAFLESGNYELHFASYTKDGLSGRYTFQSMLKSQTTLNGTIGDTINVQAGVTASVTALITGTI